jgi:hypothetical protein
VAEERRRTGEGGEVGMGDDGARWAVGMGKTSRAPKDAADG